MLFVLLDGFPHINRPGDERASAAQFTFGLFFLELASHRGVMSIALQNHGSAYISGGFFPALHGTVILERRGASIFLYTGGTGGGGRGGVMAQMGWVLSSCF